MKASEREYIFVYGTLRKGSGQQMSDVMARGTEFVGEATFQGILYDLGSYPGVIRSRLKGKRVVGDVYALRERDDVLKALDDYEGCGPNDPPPREYRRETARVTLRTGKTLNAWIYIYILPTDGLAVIDSGDYLKSRAS